jgi:hypothetical protein
MHTLRHQSKNKELNEVPYGDFSRRLMAQTVILIVKMMVMIMMMMMVVIMMMVMISFLIFTHKISTGTT